MKQLEIHGGENRPQRPSQFPLTGSLAFRETCPLITARAELVLSLLGRAEWRKLEGTSCSGSTLHRAVQLVNNPLKACKRKYFCYHDKGIENIKREMKKSLTVR